MLLVVDVQNDFVPEADAPGGGRFGVADGAAAAAAVVPLIAQFGHAGSLVVASRDYHPMYVRLCCRCVRSGPKWSRPRCWCAREPRTCEPPVHTAPRPVRVKRSAVEPNVLAATLWPLHARGWPAHVRVASAIAGVRFARSVWVAWRAQPLAASGVSCLWLLLHVWVWHCVSSEWLRGGAAAVGLSVTMPPPRRRRRCCCPGCRHVWPCACARPRPETTPRLLRVDRSRRTASKAPSARSSSRLWARR